MGTSVSHPSPRVPNWNRVFNCYKHEKIPEDRIIKELWRASENQEISISDHLKSSTAFECYKAVRTSQDKNEAQTKVQKLLFDSGNNSIITELGKRVIPFSFQSDQPSKEWRSLFFSEVTKYLVSRDASGFVGKNYRNKSVSELIEFKKSVSESVKSTAAAYDLEPKSLKDWQNYIEKTISKLKD